MHFIKSILFFGSVAILVLGILGGVLNLAQLFSIELPQSTLIIISMIFFAVYLQLTNSELRWQLSRRRDMQERIDKLARFRQEAITTLYASAPSAADFSAWLERFNSWEIALVDFLKKSFPFAVFEMFNDLGMVPDEHFKHVSNDPSIAPNHLHHLQMLAKYLRIMERLIEKNTSLLPEAKPGLGELLKWLPGD